MTLIPFSGLKLALPSGHVEYLTPEELKALSQTLAPHIAPDETPRVRAIQRAVGEAFNVDPSQLKIRRRTEWIAVPRMTAMALMSEHTDMTHQQIALYFGLKDHGVVGNSIARQNNIGKLKPAHARSWQQAARLAAQYLKDVE